MSKITRRFVCAAVLACGTTGLAAITGCNDESAQPVVNIPAPPPQQHAEVDRRVEQVISKLEAQPEPQQDAKLDKKQKVAMKVLELAQSEGLALEVSKDTVRGMTSSQVDTLLGALLKLLRSKGFWALLNRILIILSELI